MPLKNEQTNKKNGHSLVSAKYIWVSILLSTPLIYHKAYPVLHRSLTASFAVTAFIGVRNKEVRWAQKNPQICNK